MDGPQGVGANSSSDFVSTEDNHTHSMALHADFCVGAQIVQVRNKCAMHARDGILTLCCRMLEVPQDESVVRWGNEGDSFVVLEVRIAQAPLQYDYSDSTTEREIHETHPTKAFQAQQLCKLRATAQ